MWPPLGVVEGHREERSAGACGVRRGLGRGDVQRGPALRSEQVPERRVGIMRVCGEEGGSNRALDRLAGVAPDARDWRCTLVLRHERMFVCAHER